MARISDGRKSNGNGQSVSEAPEYPPDELAIIASRYRVSLVEAPTWAEYDRAMGVWRQQVLTILPELLATPDAYMVRLSALKRKRDGTPPSMGWELNQREALEAMQEHMRGLAKPGQDLMGLAVELSSEFECSRRHPIILELAQCGWLPMPPIRPDQRRRPFNAADDASRQASAEEIAGSFFDDTAPEVAHDGRAKAAGDL